MSTVTITNTVASFSFVTSYTDLTIASSGAVSGTGIYGGAGLTHESIANFGSISGERYGVLLKGAGSSVTNGSASDTPASIVGLLEIAGPAGAVKNFGNVAGNYYEGVVLVMAGR